MYTYYFVSFLYYSSSFLKAFFFGFVRNEVTYVEVTDEGEQELHYRPAPGNITEKSFDFFLNLNNLTDDFIFGGKIIIIIINHLIVMVISIADGDVSFGANVNVTRPTFRFSPDDVPEDRIVTFNVTRDNLFESEEIGQLQIAYSTSFDGFGPMFQNVRIIIKDNNGEFVLRYYVAPEVNLPLDMAQKLSQPKSNAIAIYKLLKLLSQMSAHVLRR